MIWYNYRSLFFYILTSSHFSVIYSWWISWSCYLVFHKLILVQEGFWYHHAEPSYLMLVYWVPDTKHTIPANASHRVGVGGFVMNDKREVNHVYSLPSPKHYLICQTWIQIWNNASLISSYKLIDLESMSIICFAYAMSYSVAMDVSVCVQLATFWQEF